MLTRHEAYQRCQINGLTLKRVLGWKWLVRLNEWKDEDKRTYITDDLEDAVLTGAFMRRNKGN